MDMTEVLYSTYDAKSRFSEIIRNVRQGRSVVVTYHGAPVARIVPYENRNETLEERLDRLESEGRLIPADDPGARIRPVALRPGALERFLEDRNRF